MSKVLGLQLIYEQEDPNDPLNAAWKFRNGKRAVCTDPNGLDSDNECVWVRFEDETQSVLVYRKHLRKA